MSAAQDLNELAALASARADEIANVARSGDLTDWLYCNWYIRPEAGNDALGERPPFAHLGSALSALVDRASSWENGWVVLSVGADSSVVAGLGAQTRWQQAGHFASCARPGLPPVPGEQIMTPRLLAWTDAETGQWVAQSIPSVEPPLIRIYVNVSPAEAGHAVQALTDFMTRKMLRFSMKCPGFVSGFARADALVLYLERSLWPEVERDLVDCLVQSGARLREGRPALTRPLIGGVGFAEDPGDGQSFGRSRCAILAPALGLANARPEVLPALLEGALLHAGIDPAEPWIQPT